MLSEKSCGRALSSSTWHQVKALSPAGYPASSTWKYNASKTILLVTLWYAPISPTRLNGESKCG